MTEHEREAFDQQFREQAWGMDVSEDVAWEIWQAGRTQRGVPDVSALKYVAECFLENVEEVTELLLAAGRADNIVALCNDLSRIAERAESALSITPPAEHTSDYSCPHCGAKMTQVSPADPDCDALYCNECGFNEPADSENGADIDDGTNPVPEKDIDPLFQGPDVPIEDALGAMEEEQRLDNEHFEDSLDSAISGQSKQDRLIDSVNAELCSMAYDIMLSHTISGEWPASEAAAKAKHDQLLAMVKELRGLKGRCAQHDRGQDSEPVFWWDGDMSDLDDCVRKKQSAWHTIPLYTHPAKAQGVPEAGAIIDRVIAELEAGFVACNRCGDQEDTATLDCMSDLKRVQALLAIPPGNEAKGECQITTDNTQTLANALERIDELEADNLHQRERRNAARDCIRKMADPSPWLFRRQAEAVQGYADALRLWLREMPGNPSASFADGINQSAEQADRYATRLRQQADELEAGGDQ